MSRHIIVTFQSMSEGPITIPLSRNKFVQCDFHITSYVWVGIFINGQGCRCVLDKKIAHANLNLLQVGSSGFDDVSRNEMTPS